MTTSKAPQRSRKSRIFGAGIFAGLALSLSGCIAVPNGTVARANQVTTVYVLPEEGRTLTAVITEYVVQEPTGIRLVTNAGMWTVADPSGWYISTYRYPANLCKHPVYGNNGVSVTATYPNGFRESKWIPIAGVPCS